MLQVKYYKDLSHNYMILKSDSYNEEKKYQHKMISENKIQHLLPCSIRNINDEIYFYYEISSKQSLKEIYDKEKIGYQHLYLLLEQINEAIKQIREYLLEDIHILLFPEYIYADPERQEYFFVYYPYEAANNELMMMFAEFLLEKADHDEEETLEVVYKIFELVQDGNFIITDVLQLFHKPTAEVKERQVIQELVEETKSTYSENEGEPEDVDFDGDEEENSQYRNRMIVSAILLFLCIFAIIGIFCVRYFCLLSVEEYVLSIVGIIMLIIMASLLLLYLITFRVREKRSYKNRSVAEVDEAESIPLNPYIAADEYFQNSIGNEGKNENRYGNTIFVEASLFSRENKLYGINKGNKYHIDLNQLPCTVGKMAGGVDFVIKEDTISRIHARFTKEGESINVTDLNSTNGTFKNGLRLEPNETITIEPGDEIRFGKMTFCYR